MSEILLIAKGLPASGKTYVLNRIKTLLEQDGYEVTSPTEGYIDTKGYAETITIRCLQGSAKNG